MSSATKTDRDPEPSAEPGPYRIHVVAELTGVPSGTLRAGGGR